MAEGHEPYHVPQQSRRDRLRVVAASAAAQPSFHGGAAGPYDHHHHHNHNHLMISGSNSSSTSPSSSSFSPPSDLMMTCPNLRNGPYGFDPQFVFGAPSQIMLTGTAWSNNSNNNNNHGLFHKPEPLTLSLSSYNNNNNNNVNNNINININNNYDNIGNDGVSRSAVPLGPFVGYATVLKGSRFMRPAQQLMEELCCEVIGWDIIESIRVSGEKILPDSSLLMMDTNTIVDDDEDLDHHHHDDHDGVSNKKSKLISMLDEIYRKYKQYYQQMQAVVSSFEYVSGLGNAAPYANLAVKAMSRHFGCLKSAIMDQLQFATNNNTNKLLENSNNINNGQIIRPIIRGSGLVQHQPVWRPQRGLPERAVAVLRAWLFEHFLHPYPTDTDKLMLAKQTGLSRSQVSNWFINARVRLWKPMVEEIHTLETSQSQKTTSTSRAQDDAFVGPTTTSKRTRIITESTPNNSNNNNIMSNLGSEENNVSLAYGGLANHLEVGPGRGGTHGGSVSLTLGLHRDNSNNNNSNNGFCLTEPTTAYSLNRFGSSLGLEGSDVLSSSFIGGQNRHFGGQLVHDLLG